MELNSLFSLVRGGLLLLIGIAVSLWGPGTYLPSTGHVSTRTYQRNLLDHVTPTAPRPCPCFQEALCRRINDTSRKEVYVFSLRKENWPKYDWGKITTIVPVGYHDDKLMCFAHSKGVRVIAIANLVTDVLVNATARTHWVAQQVATVENNYLDGVNVDFEGEIDRNDVQKRQGLTLLMKELNAALKRRIPTSQVAFDFAWAPGCVDKRCYDYLAIASYIDFAFVMAYDERSQIFGPCIAGANSDFTLTRTGLRKYLSLGVKAAKIILGVPWYGYKYECLQYKPGGVCAIKEVPFRGVNCSDAAGKQFDYDMVTNTFLPLSREGRQWDASSQTPYFTYQNSSTGLFHQVWYDDPTSLKVKLELAVKYNLGGAGCWEADDIHYNNQSQVEAFWGTFPF